MRNVLKKIIAFTILITLVICPLKLANGEEKPISVVIDGRELAFDVEPTIENGRLLVPLRAIFEALNAEISWDGDTKTITAIRGNKKVLLTIDKDISYVNDKEYKLDVPAKIFSGRTLVPVRFVSESLGENVEWNGDTRTVFITTVSNNRGNTIGNISNYGFAVENDDWIFYNYDETKIIRINKENGERDVVLEKEGIDSLNLIDDKLYYDIYDDDEVDEGIYVIDLNNNEIQKLCEDSACDINIVDGYIYYINYSDDGTIYRMNIDGSEKQKINSLSFYSLVVEGDWMYVINSIDDYKLSKLKTDGTELIVLDNEHSDCSYINISGEWIYYILDYEDGIFRVKKDGSEQQKLITKNVSLINVYKDYVFFSYEEVNDKSYLCRIDKNGQNLMILDSKDNDYEINLIDNTIYCYTDQSCFDYVLAGLYCLDFDGNVKKRIELGSQLECEFINDNKNFEFEVFITKEINNPLISVKDFKKLLRLKSSSIKYKDSSNEITIKGDNPIRMTLDSNEAYINNEIVYLDDCPTKIDGEIFIPLNFALKSYEMYVQNDTISRKYFITNNKDFAKVKELIELSNINTSKVNKYKINSEISYSFDTDDIGVNDFSILINSKQDNIKEIAELNYDLSASVLTGGMASDKKDMFYYKGNKFVKYYPSEIWQEESVSTFEWDMYFRPLAPISKSDIIYYRELKVNEDEVDSIVLEGEIQTEIFNYLITNMAGEDLDYNIKSSIVKIVIDKETNCIQSTSIIFKCNIEDVGLRIEFNQSYSDFNGDFEINIPDGFITE